MIKDRIWALMGPTIEELCDKQFTGKLYYYYQHMYVNYEEIQRYYKHFATDDRDWINNWINYWVYHVRTS